MATWNQTKTNLEKMIAKKQEVLDWFDPNSSSQTWNFVMRDSNDNEDNYTYTGTGGGNSYWAQWRSDHPNLNGSNGTDLENLWYQNWTEWNDEVFTLDGNPTSKGEIIARTQTEKATFEDLLAVAQAEIDAGNGDVEAPTE